MNNFFKEYFQPLTRVWNRIKIEYRFAKGVIPPLKSKIKYKNKVNLAKALRLTELKGIRDFHFTFTEDYYKKTPDEKIVEYINLIHKLILVAHTPENGFTPMEEF